MSKKNVPAWNEERVQKLVSIVGTQSPVSNETVNKAADALETTPRSIAAKLRNLDIEVAHVDSTREKTFSAAEETELRKFVESNSGKFTYGEIAAAVLKGKFESRQIQGKILSMELTNHVKPTPKKEVERKYSEAEESKIVAMMKKDGVYLEDIATALNKPLNSIRGKCLSLSRANDSLKIPPQKNHVAKDRPDALTNLGDVSDLTVEDIAVKISKTERGVKAMLTKRGLKCKNYDGAAKRAKADRKASDND